MVWDIGICVCVVDAARIRRKEGTKVVRYRLLSIDPRSLVTASPSPSPLLSPPSSEDTDRVVPVRSLGEYGAGNGAMLNKGCRLRDDVCGGRSGLHKPLSQSCRPCSVRGNGALANVTNEPNTEMF